MVGRGSEDPQDGERRQLSEPRSVTGILFDKDGTLLDFAATWGPATAAVLAALSNGDEELAERLGRLAGFDRAAGTFHPDSPIIAGDPDSFGPDWARLLGVAYDEAFYGRANALFREHSLKSLTAFEEVDAVLENLQAAGFAIGLATNDAEENARAHLDAMGVTDRFSFIAGYDSGYGAKPAPGMIEAFARSIGAETEAVAMVGDTRHDLDAARAAGAIAIAVVRDEAEIARFEGHADIILADLNALATTLRFTGKQ